MKQLLKFLCLSLLLLWNVSTLVAHEFPLCIYSVATPEDVTVAKKAGFTCIQSYTQDPEKLAALAAQAKKQGLKTVFYPQKVIGSSYEKQAAFWPMLAWYIVDEPDVAHWSRERVQQAEQKAKNAFSQQATSLVIGQGRTRISYYDLTDIMMVDWYPVPHLALTSFGDNVRWTKQGMQAHQAGDRPLWGVVQLFDWKTFKQYRPDNDRIGRFPTEDEIRFMSYDGIANGATGLFYFHFYHQKTPLAQASPQTWKAVENVLKELGKFRPVLEEGQFLGQSSKVSAPLMLQAWLYKGHTYFLLLNRSDRVQPIPAELLTKPYKPLFSTKKTAKIQPYSVWLLKK